MSKRRDKEAVLFDMDGTLIDTEPLFKSVAKKAALKIGYEITDSVYEKWIGLSREDLEKQIISSMGKKFPMETFSKLFAEIWETYTKEKGIKCKNGIKQLVKFLYFSKIPMAVATSTPSTSARRSLKIAGLNNFFTTVIGGDEVKRGKPAPDIYHLAAKNLNVKAENCIAIEDSLIGISSAKAAGALSIFVPDSTPPTEKIMAVSDYILPTGKEAGMVIKRILDLPD